MDITVSLISQQINLNDLAENTIESINLLTSNLSICIFFRRSVARTIYTFLCQRSRKTTIKERQCQ
jgi:hypothetical protein